MRDRCDRCGLSFMPGALSYSMTLILTSRFDGIIVDDGKGEERFDLLIQEMDGLDESDLEEMVHLERNYTLCPRCRTLVLKMVEGEMKYKVGGCGVEKGE